VTKTMVRSSQSDFVDLRPGVRFQCRIASWSSLQRVPGRFAGRSSQAAQDAPNVGLVISHSTLVLDQFAHSTRGTQAGGIAKRLGTALESLFDLVELDRAQLRPAPGAPALFQTRANELRKLPHPARITDCRWTPKRRAASPWLTLCLSNSAAFIRRRFQKLEVPPHSRRIAHKPKLSQYLYYARVKVRA